MRRILLASIVMSFGLLATSDRAQAGGLEYAGGGTSALGRGGANIARADSPMVLSKNPAGLAELRGDQLLLNLDTAVMDACVTPTGYYGWGTYGQQRPTSLRDPATGEITELALGTVGEDAATDAYYRDPYDKVCLDQAYTPIPQLAFSLRLSERLGIGAGIIFPSVTPQGTWGSANGVIRGDTGELRPAATRYMLMHSGNIGVFPTVGFGYRLLDSVRIGAALEWGMFSLSNTVMSAVDAGANPKSDLISTISAEDFFVPAINISIHLVPFDALDIVLGARMQDDIDATGRISVLSGEFDPALQRHVTSGLQVTGIQQSFPWKLWGGIRFADRVRARPTGTGADEGNGGPGSEPVHDAFGDERWDVEFDVVYEANGRVTGQDVDMLANQVIDFVRTDGSVTAPTLFPAPDTPPVYIPKRWKDQISLRLGGSINVVPGLFGVNFGAHYENRGIDPAYMQLDFWPVERLGLHAGLIVRLAGSVDLSFSYAHVFQETIVVGAPPHDIAGAQGVDKSVGIAASAFEPAATLEEATNPTEQADGTAALRQVAARATAGRPVIVNAGKYESSIDVISAGVQMHF